MVIYMIINYTTLERNNLARLMRAEAVGEGEKGMLMVGNVVVNRVLANCLTFKNINTITAAINQPNQFAGVNSSLYQSYPTTMERNLADKVLKGEYFWPASNALWFYAPKEGEECLKDFYGEKYVGKYKKHCFYIPDPKKCPPRH